MATAGQIELIIKKDNSSDLKQIIIERVRELVHSDFHKLINILYRMDVSEIKLRKKLEENPDNDAGLIITELMIERQAQKIKTRRETERRDENIGEEDKW